MDRRSKKIVREAARRIDSGENNLTCIALEHAQGTTASWSPLTLQYKTFYFAEGISSYDFDARASRQNARNHRVLALLLFAEAGL